MINIISNKKRKTKNILAVLFCAIISLVLSFTTMIETAKAETDLPVDFVVATTSLKEANKYNFDNQTVIYTQSNNGNYYKFKDGKYYKINLQQTVNEVLLKSIKSPTGTEITNFASLEDYYKNDGSLITSIPDDGKYYRCDAAGKVNPIDTYIKASNTNATPISGYNNIQYNNDYAIVKFVINDKNVYLQLIPNNRYNPDYDFGYTYKNFKDEYKSVTDLVFNFDTTIPIEANKPRTVTYDPTNGWQTKDITINPFIMVPTTSNGDIVNFGENWMEVKYCYFDGTVNDELTGTTEYVILEENTTDPDDIHPIKIWAELNTNKYYIYDTASGITSLINNDKNGETLPILYAYKLNSGLYSKKSALIPPAGGGAAPASVVASDEYQLLKNYEITDITANTICITKDSIPYNIDFENLFINNYYYNIFKAIKHNDRIIGYDLYNNELKTQANYLSAGTDAFINNYFAEDNLNDLYYLDCYTNNADPDNPVDYHKFSKLYNNVYVNNAKQVGTTTNSANVILDNYNTQKELFGKSPLSTQFNNVENLYLSFGDIYHSEYNQNTTLLLNDLTVDIKLYNSYYNGIQLAINDVVTQENAYSDSNNIIRNNEFWFQYLDLNNLRYYISTEQDTAIVEHNAGKYVVTIKYNTFNIGNETTSNNQSFEYVINIDETSNKLDYPVLIADNQPSVIENKNLQYSYNFQTLNYPALIFDASKYDVSYVYNYSQYSDIKNTTTFKVYQRNPIKSSSDTNYNYKQFSEYSILDWNEAGLINNEEYSQTTSRTKTVANATIITANGTTPKFKNINYDSIQIIEYTYYTEQNPWNNTNYTKEDYGTFEKKIVNIVGFTGTEYHIYYYSTDSITAASSKIINEETGEIKLHPNYLKNSNLLKYKSVNEFVDDYITITKGFDSKKYDLNNTFECFDFEYLFATKFDQLGEYEFDINYNTSIQPVSTKTNMYNVSYGSNLSDLPALNANYFTNTNKNIGFSVYPIIEKYIILNGASKTNPEGAIINYIKSGYDLDIFGVKSYFNKYNVTTGKFNKTEFKYEEENIYSDLTAHINEDPYKTLGNTKGITLKANNTSIIAVPNTNQVPVYFDYLCNYVYTNQISESFIYRYPDFTYNDNNTCTVNDIDNCLKYYFNKNSRPEDDGYYEIIIKYKQFEKDTNYHYQVFAFVIDNSSPSVSYNTLREKVESDTFKYSYWDSMSRNIYTNSVVRATWRTANYFQYEVIPTLSKENYTGVSANYGSSNNSGTIYDISVEPTIEDFAIKLTNDYSIELIGNAEISLDSNKIIYTTLPETEQVKYEIFSYNTNLKKVPMFNILVNGIYLKNEADDINLYPSDMYNAKLVNEIKSLIFNGNTIQIKLIAYQWQFMVYPTTSYTSETGETINYTGNIWGSGNYSLKLTFGSSSSSNTVSSFTIDTLPIQNIVSKRVSVNATFNEIYSEFTSGSNMLINEPFTLTYDPKNSKAKIETYYVAIPLTSTNKDLAQLYLNNNGEIGVSTDSLLSTKTSYTNKNYNYDYSYNFSGDKVPTSNVLQSSGSTLFVFYLKDAAGNTANYCVFYDNTTPEHVLTLSPKDKDSTSYKLYNIITDNTTLFWGNYKAIEIFSDTSNILDTDYVKNIQGHINYTPSPIELALSHLYYNGNLYLNTTFKTFWQVNGEWNEKNEYVNGEWVEVDYFNNSAKENLINSFDDVKTTTKDSGIIEERFFILIPLDTVKFEYYSTNSNDNNTKYYSFDMFQAGSKNNVLISPSATKLATLLGNVTRETILSSPMGTYGFYGDNMYYYNIYDVLGNTTGGDFWMNTDQTLAMGYVLMENSSSELSSTKKLNVEYATPYSSYASSQLYFSYLNNETDASIPKADFAYKYYPFADLSSNGFYNNYTISDIKIDDTNNTYTFQFSTIDEEGNLNPSEMKEYKIDMTKTNNYNQDGQAVDEKNSHYPFELNYSSNGLGGWTDITNATSGYKRVDDKDRIFTNIINKQDQQTNKGESLSTGLYSSPGLYVFRRVYTDYIDINRYNSTGVTIVDTSKLQNDDLEDQAVRYYVYYIDRYSILDLSSTELDKYIDSYISISLGEYINSATEDESGNIIYNNNYAFVQNNKYISNTITNKSSTIPGKQITYNGFETTKPYVSINLPIDKYNQTRIVERYLKNYDTYLLEDKNKITGEVYGSYYNQNHTQLTSVQKEELRYKFYVEFMAYYIFDNQQAFDMFNGNTPSYYHSKFLLKAYFINGNKNYIIENNQIVSTSDRGMLNSYNSQNNTISAITTNQQSRLNLTKYNDTSLTSIVINSSGVGEGIYKLILLDQSGTTIANDYDNDTSKYIEDFNGNKFEINKITLKRKSNVGAFLGKEFNSSYNTNNTDNYANSLFDINNGDINSLTALSNGTTAFTNNETLIFFIDNSIIDTNIHATTNPYKITITKQDENGNTTTIFKTNLTFSIDTLTGTIIPTYTYDNCNSSIDSMKKAFVDNSYTDAYGIYHQPTKWAIVIYDNYFVNTNGESIAYNNLLSNPKDNATYSVTVSHFGNQSDYMGYQTFKENSLYETTYSVTVDHIKPVYNSIYLMENDNYISKNGLVFNTYNNYRYTNIQDYYEYLQNNVQLGNITNLQAQKHLSEIYNTYLTSYKNTKLNYNLTTSPYLNEITDQYGDNEHYWNNYYFTVNDDFSFKRILTDTYSGLDSYYQIFFKQIEDISTYRYSLTLDDFVSTSDATLQEHTLFTDTLANNTNNIINKNTYYKTTVVDKETNETYINNIFKDYGFYEIIERDASGNYRVYLIKYSNHGNEFKFNYKVTEDDVIGIQDNLINAYNQYSNLDAVMGYSLSFNDKSNIDNDVLKIELSYMFQTLNEDGTTTAYNNSTSPIVLYSSIISNRVDLYYDTSKLTNYVDITNYLNAITNIKVLEPDASSCDTVTDRLIERLNLIISYISKTYKETALDYKFNIKIYDRLYNLEENGKGYYELTFLTPGKELEPIITYKTDNTGFIITIPDDNPERSTIIKDIKVYTFENEQTQRLIDDNGTNINFVGNLLSLGGKSFYFKYYKISDTYGAFKVVITDNFNRTFTHYYSKPDSTRYDVSTIKTQTYIDKTYTASDIVIKYNNLIYDAIIFEDLNNESRSTYTISTNYYSNIYPDKINENLIKFDGNSKWTRYNDQYETNTIYTVTREIVSTMTTVTIHQEVDKQTDFIIMIIEKPTSDEICQKIYDYLFKNGGYYYFVDSVEANNCIYFDDFTNNKLTLYTYIPEIQLTNLSGKLITTSKRTTVANLVYIEPLIYKIKTNNELFNPTISIIKNGSAFSQQSTKLDDGKYEIFATNDLGYTKSIQFEINSKNATSDYSVYKVDNGAQIEMQKSSYISSIYFDSYNNAYSYQTNQSPDYTKNRLYHYYALNNYANYEDDNNYNWHTILSKQYININVNTNNGIKCELINYYNPDRPKYDPNNQDHDPNHPNVINSADLAIMGHHALYKVLDNSNKIIEFFVVHFMQPTQNTELSGIKLNSTKSYNSALTIQDTFTISRTDETLYLIFANYSNPIYNNTVPEYYQGNTLTLTYYYNLANSPTQKVVIKDLNKFVENGNTYYYYTLTSTGVHTIEISDLAGNTSIFANQSKLDIYLVNSILYTINGIEPIPNFITNDSVVVNLIENINGINLYTINQDITITKNGQPYTINQTAKNEFTFTEAGTYIINVSGTNETINSKVSHSIEFTIVNPNVAYHSYSISSAKGFTIVSVTRKLENLETSKENLLTNFSNLNSLIISCDNEGAGYYKITLSRYLESIKSEQLFTFKVWLNNRTDTTIIHASIPFGSETVDPITLQYNLANIFNNVGDSYITINNEIIETINSSSISETKTYTITEKGIYWVKILSANGQILASYKLTKNDPLNATAIIIIIIAVVSVIVLTILFFIMRKKVKFR